MAKSTVEQIRDLGMEFRAMTEREGALRREVEERRAQDEKRQDEIAELRRELTTERIENAKLKQQLQDHVKQTEVADGRRWALVVVLVSAVLSLASGLIVTLAKK